MFRKLLGAAVGAIVLLLALQLVPYGRNHANPPVYAEPVWDSPQTREMTARACFDCHSNETRWLWYSNVAPVSWLIQRDVDSGRKKLNFSQWGQGEQEVDDAAESVQKGKMPPLFYLPMHPEAQLSASERSRLAQGLVASLGVTAEGKETGSKDDDD